MPFFSLCPALPHVRNARRRIDVHTLGSPSHAMARGAIVQKFKDAQVDIGPLKEALDAQVQAGATRNLYFLLLQKLETLKQLRDIVARKSEEKREGQEINLKLVMPQAKTQRSLLKLRLEISIGHTCRGVEILVF